MRKYFYSNGVERMGPFSIDELKKENLTRETKVWFYGLDEWTPLSEIEELNSFANQKPPNLKNNESTEDQTIDLLKNTKVEKELKRQPKKSKSNLKRNILIIFLTIIVLFICFIVYSSQQDIVLYNNISETAYESDVNFDFYVNKFYRDINVYGIFPKKPENIIIKFAKLDQINDATHIHGISYGFNDDDKIEIYINQSTWDKFNKPMRYYLMYHELSHDVLNLDDLECTPINEGKLMYPVILSYENKTMDDFIESSHALFEDVANQ